MTDGGRADAGDTTASADASPDTMLCEGDACAVAGAGPATAVRLTAPAAATDWLDGLLVKQISQQVELAGASMPLAGPIKEDESDGI